MNVIFPMYFGEKRGCSSAGSSSSSRKLKKCFSCYTYALEWGQQQCPCKFQLLVFLNTHNLHVYHMCLLRCLPMQDCLIICFMLLWVEVSERGRHLAQYLNLFLIHASLGVSEKTQLLKSNVASLLMTVALDYGPGPPIKYQYAELNKLYQVVSSLVWCCYVSSRPDFY